MKNKEFYSIAELASYTGLSVPGINYWISKGLPREQIGAAEYKYSWTEIKVWMESRSKRLANWARKIEENNSEV